MKITALGVFLLGLSGSLAAQDSTVISGLKLTLGAPRADVEQALQAKFQVELAPNGEWALWEKGQPRHSSLPYDEPPPTPKPHVKAGFIDRGSRAGLENIAMQNRNIDTENDMAFRAWQARRGGAAGGPQLRFYPVGAIKFSDDGKLCRISKEWNPSPGSAANAMLVLGGALSAHKGQEITLDSSAPDPCFFFPSVKTTLCARSGDDGTVSITETIGGCAKPRLTPTP